MPLGLMGYALRIYEMDTWGEIIDAHDAWLGDVATQLITKYPWDLFCMHSHPIDWIYHAILTEMDPNTCSHKESYEQAWALHLRVRQSQDKMLARIVEAAGEETLFVIVSDHGAVADGPSFNPYLPLDQERPLRDGRPGRCLRHVGHRRELSPGYLGFKEFFGDRQSQELAEMGTWSQLAQDMNRSKALPSAQYMCT